MGFDHSDKTTDSDRPEIVITDETSGVHAKVDSQGRVETTAQVGTVAIEELLSQDLLADTWFAILTFGAATDVIRVQIPDDSVDVSSTLTGATDLLTARDKVITDLNADGTFSALYEAVAIKDNAFVHISSILNNEAGEHLDVNDFQVSVTSGTTTVDLPSGNDVIESRKKISSGARNPDDRRFAAVAISGDVFVQAGRLENLISRFAMDGSTMDMSVDGSSTPVVYTIDADATYDLFFQDGTWHGVANGIKFGKFLSLNSPLTNGILLEAQSNNEPIESFVIKTTDDFKALWSTTQGFELDVQAGGDHFRATWNLGLTPYTIRKQGTFGAGNDDFVKITIRDDLSALGSLFFTARGFRKA